MGLCPAKRSAADSIRHFRNSDAFVVLWIAVSFIIRRASQRRCVRAGRLGGLMGLGMYEWIRTDTPVKRNPKVDEITFFIPDDQYLPHDDGDPAKGIYPESFLEMMHTSMVPELKILDEAKEERHQVHSGINGISSLHGAMLNVQFQIERHDEIRMYIHWNAQCIRLHPQDFWLVLPRIFVKGRYRNAEFPNDEAMQRRIRETFEMPDKYFEYFYKYMSVYHQQKKDWIDKPTKVEYVN